MQTIPNPTIREMVLDLMTLGMTTPSAQADVFVGLSPHCDCLHVDFHEHGWMSGVSATWSETVSLGHADAIDELRRVTDRVHADLRGITPEALVELRIARKVNAIMDAFAFVPAPQSVAA